MGMPYSGCDGLGQQSKERLMPCALLGASTCRSLRFDVPDVAMKSEKIGDRGADNSASHRCPGGFS